MVRYFYDKYLTMFNIHKKVEVTDIEFKENLSKKKEKKSIYLFKFNYVLLHLL